MPSEGKVVKKSQGEEKNESTINQHHDTVDPAMSAGFFKTLVTAVKAAGLVDTRKGKRPFTVFARTHEALADLPAGTVESLLWLPPK